MKIHFKALLFLILVGLINMGFDIAHEWKMINNKYSVTFVAGSISGNFTGLKTNIQFDEAHPETSSISATINADSLSTGFFLGTRHTKSALEVNKYPNIKFNSVSIKRNGLQYDAEGNLTLKDQTKPVVIHFSFDGKDNKGMFKGSFIINPKDFNITKFGTPDQVKIDLIVPVTK